MYAGLLSSMRAHGYPLRTSMVSAQQALPTLPVEPVVTLQPPVNVARLLCRRRADDSLLSSGRNSSEPVAPAGFRSMSAQGEPLEAIFCLRSIKPPSRRPVDRLRASRRLPSAQRVSLRVSTIPSDGSPPSDFDPTRE